MIVMSLDLFFDPKSVAVVGASRQKGKVGHEIVAGLVSGGFPGDIFPVNPNADEVEGLKCYPSLEEIGSAPDLVVIVVPPKFRNDLIQAAEVAFIVHDEWQAKGMGSFLLDHITQVAIKRGVKRFYAKVLPKNKPMLAIFQHSGHKVTTEFDGEVFSIACDLDGGE